MCRGGDRERLRTRAGVYARMCKAHPQTRFYIFPTLAPADWCVAAGTYGVSDYGFVVDKYVRDFRSMLEPSIEYTWAGEGLLAEEVVSWYYRTDHHWNMKGAYQAYVQIWRLLQTRNAEISAVREVQEWFELPNIIFYGSYARRAGYFDSIHDTIVDGYFNLPELTIHVHGADKRVRNEKEQYKAGHPRAAKFANHYGGYFGDDYGLVEYMCEVGSGCLLVVGDSYDNCIEPLLASHFRHTYFVDLRHYVADVGDHFEIDDFIEQNQITDVLFTGNQRRVLGLSSPGEID